MENEGQISQKTPPSSPGERPRWDQGLEDLPVGLFFVSNQGQIVKMNKTIRSFLPMEAAQWVGKSYHIFFNALSAKAQTPEVIRKALYAAHRSLPKVSHVNLELEGDPHRHIQLSLFPWQDEGGQGVGWGGVVNKGTQRVDRANQTAVYATGLIKESRKTLASIQGQLRALSEQYLHWDTEMVGDVFKTLLTELNEVTGQVEQTMEILRFQDEGLVIYPEKVPLEDLVYDLTSRQSAQYPDLEFQLDLEGDLPPVRVDPQRVNDVFRDVIRYVAGGSPPGSEISIGAIFKGNGVEISIVGEGDAGENQGFVSEPGGELQQNPFEDRLWMSKEIIQTHGGEMWVDEPDHPERVKVSFTLPLMPLQRSFRIRRADSSPEEATTGDILIAESDPESLHLLSFVLREEGHKVRVASDGPSVVDIVQASTPDLIILEWDLPGMNGLRVSKYIRRWTTRPIFMLTSKTNPENLIEAFEAGVDDYLTKPFLVDEVLVRVKALLRRSGEGDADSKTEIFESRGLRINFETRRVWLHGDPVDLTPLEYKILTYMTQHRRQVLPYQQLIEHVWDAPDKGSRRGLFVHISRLREKIEQDPEDPEFIVNRWGVGYAFLPN